MKKTISVLVAAALALIASPALAFAPYTYSCVPASAQPEGGADVTVLIHNPQASAVNVSIAIKTRDATDVTAALGVPTSIMIKAGKVSGASTSTISWIQPTFAPPAWSEANKSTVPLSVKLVSDAPISASVVESSGDFTAASRTCSLTPPQIP